jgi:hypothetical protein
MSSRIVVTVTAGELRLSFEIADQEVTFLEAPTDWARPLTASDVVGALLPMTRGAPFAITAQLHKDRRPR